MSQHDYFTFRFAVLGGRYLTCDYQGRKRTLYPHSVGERDGRQAAVCYELEDEPSAASSKGQWLSLFIADVSNVLSRRGGWHTGEPETFPRRFIETVDVEISDEPDADDENADDKPDTIEEDDAGTPGEPDSTASGAHKAQSLEDA